MLNEVAPPGWGHTKAEKEKTKPWKPKSKIGGTAAAFKRALDDGRFKGLPGSKTKKEKTADMFKLMWSMKKKGDKPHYKPGTDKKYKKYQEEDWKPEIEVVDTKARAKKAEKKRKEAEKSLPPHLKLDAMRKAFASSHSDKSNMFTQESLGFTIDSGEHKKASKKAKMRNLAKGNTNPNEKAAAEKKAGGPKLYGEEVSRRNKPSAVAKKKKLEKLLIDKEVNKIQKEATYQEMIDAGWEMTGEGIWWPPQPETVTEKLSFAMFKKKAAEKKPEKAMDAGAKARRRLQRKEYSAKISGSQENVPDDLKDD